MGPAPMIRMVEMSVLLGIESRGTGNWAQKKGAHTARPSTPSARLPLRAGWSLEQIPQPRKGLKGPINRHFPSFALRATGRFQSVYAFAWLKLRRTRFAHRSGVAAPRVARQG